MLAVAGSPGRGDRRPPAGFNGFIAEDQTKIILSGAETQHGYHVAFRGYLSNRQALRRLLAASESASNAHLVAAAYRNDPENFILRLDGQFAVVVVDAASEKIILAHDPVGLSPLFYTSGANNFAFSTHLLDLIGAAGASDDLDQEYIADFLAFGQPTTERTPFKRIRRLVPGELICWQAGQPPRRRQIWSAAQISVFIPENAEEQGEQFRHLLNEAIGGAASSHAHVWTELSGGLDSSTVAAISVGNGIPVSGVGVIYPEWPAADESRYARLVAESLAIPYYAINGCVFRPFSAPPGDFIGEPSPLSYSGSLLGEWDRLLEKHNVTALMTGMGGDEVLGANPGLPVHLSDPLFNGRLPSFLNHVKAWKSSTGRSWYYALKVLGLATAARHLRGRQVWHVPSNSLPHWIEPSFRRSMFLDTRCARRLAPRCLHPGRQFLADVLWLNAVNLSNRGQRRSTYEILHPLLHRPLIEFMACLPWRLKVLPDADRILHRQAMRTILPESVRVRRTKGGGSWSLVEGLRQAPWWMDFLTNKPHIVQHGLVNHQKWRLAVERARLGHTGSDRYFMAAVSLETWFYQLRIARSAL